MIIALYPRCQLTTFTARCTLQACAILQWLAAQSAQGTGSGGDEPSPSTAAASLGPLAIGDLAAGGYQAVEVLVALERTGQLKLTATLSCTPGTVRRPNLLTQMIQPYKVICTGTNSYIAGNSASLNNEVQL